MSISAVLGAALLTAAKHPPPPLPSLCRAGEPMTYTCPVRRKLLSICGRGAQAIYRFGRPGHVELEAGDPTFVEQGFSGGGETQVTFRHGDTSYLVYQSTIRTNFGPSGRNDPKFSEGVIVQRGGRTLADIGCTGLSGGDLTNGASGAPPAPYVEH